VAECSGFTCPEAVAVGAAEGCDLLILIFLSIKNQKQSQKIAAFGSSYEACAFIPLDA
jgi:hypothetical protein